jgi:hypothetical protein
MTEFDFDCSCSGKTRRSGVEYVDFSNKKVFRRTCVDPPTDAPALGGRIVQAALRDHLRQNTACSMWHKILSRMVMI